MTQIVIIAPTHLSSFRFKTESLVARSLRRLASNAAKLIQIDSKDKCNKLNEIIDSLNDSSIVITLFNDLWFDDWLFPDSIKESLEDYDLCTPIGLKINKTDPRLKLEELLTQQKTINEIEVTESIEKVGALCIGDNPLIATAKYGGLAKGALDFTQSGFLAFSAGTFKENKIAFDMFVENYFTTTDICMQYMIKGLTVGTSNIAVTEPQKGNSFRAATYNKEFKYLCQKWLDLR